MQTITIYNYWDTIFDKDLFIENFYFSFILPLPRFYFPIIGKKKSKSM